MNKTDLAHYRHELRAIADRVRNDSIAVAQQTQGGSGGQAGGELSNAPMHLGDRGTEEYLHDLNAALLENEEYLAGEAIAAILRLDDGTFGLCESCGQEIHRERLDALPYTRFCIDCADASHAGHPVNVNFGRPHGPPDTLAPEGSMGERRSRKRRPADPLLGTQEDDDHVDHGIGTAGGGTALGGLAGTNVGHGDPDVSELDEAMGSGDYDVTDARDDHPETPRSGHAGGAVGGTPARKRAK